MRALAAVLLLALVAAGCGGGGSSEATAPPALPAAYAQTLREYEAAVLYSITDQFDPGGAYARQALADVSTVEIIATDFPESTYPTFATTDGEWTARDLLAWAATNGNPRAARAAREALGSLP